MNIYRIIIDYIQSNQAGVLATIILRSGSAPRDVGTKMFIGEDGKAYGTVGGGTLEAQTYKEALEIMRTNAVRTLDINVNSQRASDRGMICGGDVRILLEPIASHYEDMYEKASSMTSSRQKGIIVTGFESGVLTKTLLDSHGAMMGDVPDADTIMRVSKLMATNRSSLMEGFFADMITIPNRLYIFGAGHVAEYLAKTAVIADFEITVIDDRRELANRERFPHAGEIILANISSAFNCLEFTGGEYVVIASWSHEQDSAILGEVLNRETKYVGMIGSKRKIATIADQMRKKGIREDLISSIHTPIGVPINAETPQEIAISIAAELIKVKNSAEEMNDKANENS